MPDQTIIPQNEVIEIIRQTSQDEIQDMLGNPPSWLLRSGITMAFIVLLIGLTLSWLIRYPDKIEVPVLLQSEYPPTEIIAPSTQRIATLKVKDRTYVQQGQLLAIYENPANWTAIQQVIAFQEQLSIALNTEKILTIQVPVHLDLGALQNTYANLIQSFQYLQYSLQQNDIKTQVSALEREIKRISTLKKYAIKEKELLSKELVLTQKNLKRTQQLHDNGLVSTLELEQKEAIWLQQQRQIEQLESSNLQNQIRQEQLKSQQEQLHQNHHKEHTRLELALQQQLEKWQSDLANWQQTYLVTAPVAGQIAFAPQLNKQRYVKAGEVLFTLLPKAEKGRIVAHCYLPTNGLGKIGKSAVMKIMLDAYPAKEFGTLSTHVENIALIPQSSTEGVLLYHTTAFLPDTLKTTYEQSIPFQQKLTGMAMILTEDKRLLERIFEQLTDLLKNS